MGANGSVVPVWYSFSARRPNCTISLCCSSRNVTSSSAISFMVFAYSCDFCGFDKLSRSVIL